MTALTEGQRLGCYRVIRQLGEGGMGAVYEARQEPLERRVALKTLHAEHARNTEAVARFFNEAKTLSRLEHPSIVQVSDFGNSTDGTAYLVMEYLRGKSLGKRLREFSERGERYPVVTALQIAFQAADALAIAHTHGIVHRDVKPENMMLVADAIAPGGERLKLLDFGIAKLTHDGDKGGVKTGTQTLMGTPSYMSPEQCAGAGGVDAKTDVYALGCVLFEILAGRPPFIAEGSGQLIGMHLFQPPPALSSLAAKVPEPVVALVHRLLIKDKLQRPGMSEAADEIGRLIATLTGGSPLLRSRPAELANAEDEQAPVGSFAATTIGRSIGQLIDSRPRRTLLFGCGLLALLGLGLTLSWRPQASTGAQPTREAAKSAPTPIAVPPSAPIPEAAAPPSVVRAPPTSQKDGASDAKIPMNGERNESQRVKLTRNPPAVRPGPAKALVQKPAAVTPAPPIEPPPPKHIGYEK